MTRVLESALFVLGALAITLWLRGVWLLLFA